MSSAPTSFSGITLQIMNDPDPYLRYLNLTEHRNTRRETTTSIEQQSSTSPPAYDDLPRRSSTTITMEQQILQPPPTYDDFMRGK
jgi:hypothetical protein